MKAEEHRIWTEKLTNLIGTKVYICIRGRLGYMGKILSVQNGFVELIHKTYEDKYKTVTFRVADVVLVDEDA